MGVTSVSLPQWKGREHMYQSEVGSYDKLALKYKKITDYTESVHKAYRDIRKVKSTIEGNHYKQVTWLGTRHKDNSSLNFHVKPDGAVYYESLVTGVFGIRPAIEY